MASPKKYASCYLKVSETLKRELTKDEKEMIRDVMREAIDNPGADGILASVTKRIEQEKLKAEFKAAIEKRNSLFNYAAKNNLTKSLDTHFENAPHEWLRSLFIGSHLKREGAGVSIASLQKSMWGDAVSTMESRLAKAGLTEIAEKNEFEKELFMSLHELSMKEPNPEILGKFPPEVVELAKILGDLKEQARLTGNKWGAWTGKIEGHAIPQSHSAVKLAAAAGKLVKDTEVHFQKWKEAFEQAVDWKKTWPDVLPENRLEAMRGMYNEVTTGVDLNPDSEASVKSGFRNFGSGLSKSRSVHFKDAEYAYNYFKAYGDGDNVIDALVNHLRKVYNKTAIMQKLGPNAELNLKTVVDNAAAKYVKAGKTEEAKMLVAEYKNQMKYYWPHLTGEATIPVSSKLAQVSHTVKSWEVVSTYGLSMLSSIPDPAFAASTLNYATGDNIVTGTLKILGEMVSQIGKKNSLETKAILSQLGVAMDTLQIHDSPANDQLPGKMSELTRKFFKWNGQTWWTNKTRQVSTMMTSHKHALYAGKSFEELPKAMQDYFRRFDINEKAWDIYRSGELQTDAHGRQYLTPEGIADKSLDAFDSLIPEDKMAAIREAGNDPKMLERARETARDTLIRNGKALFFEIAEFASSEPGAAERAIMAFGTQRGTVPGEALQHLFLGKSFAISMVRKHWGRAWKGHSPESMSFPQLLKFMFTKPGESGLSNMAQTMAMGTLLGIMSNGVKDVVKGINPIPTNLDADKTRKMVGAGLLSSGGLAIYGDFLFSKSNRYAEEFGKTLAGQTAGNALSILQLGHDIATKDKKDVGTNALRLATRNIPFYNLPPTKWAADYLFINSLHEMINRGKLKENERKLKRETGKEYFAPPSSTNLYRSLK